MRASDYNPFIYSVLLHVGLVLALLLNLELSHPMPVLENINNGEKVINAVAVSSPLHESQPQVPRPAPQVVPHLPPQPKPKVVMPAPVVKPMVKPVVKLPPPVPAPVVQAKQLEKQIQHQENAIALQLQHKKRVALQKAEIEKQLLADFKKHAVKNKNKQQAVAAAMEKELREQTEKSLQQQLLKAQEAAAAARAQGEVDKFKALILQAISRRWLVPAGVDRSISAELFIHLAPDGSVLDVQITKSSGDVSLDRSARDAVFKASPLPVPTESVAFDQFRQFVLKMKPENIIHNGIAPG